MWAPLWQPCLTKIGRRGPEWKVKGKGKNLHEIPPCVYEVLLACHIQVPYTFFHAFFMS